MDVEFRDKKLAPIETDRAAAETGLAIALIESARDKLNYIRQAVDERDLRNWKSLHFEKLEGDRSGQRSIRLNKQFRLVFTLDNERIPPKITVLSIEDYH
ncbi:MAG: plasmid maintenance system killer protein [Acidobacteria bacterium]|nr:MAG: plasmid maintenance system killer protein [Acidobacteriota bacterium]